MLRRRSRLAEEVAQAYYKYGRFCCSHPYATLAHSLSMVLFLSYPLLCARWFYPSPCVLVKTANLTYSSNADDLAWLNNYSPVAYVLQVILHAAHNSNSTASFSSSQVMRSFFEMAFELRNRTANLRGCCSQSMLWELWPLTDTANVKPVCRLLAPSGLWNHSRHALLADRHFPNSLHPDKSTVCKGELLMGTAEIPIATDTRWHYGMTVMITGAQADQALEFRNALGTLGHGEPFSIQQQEMENDEVLHIYYTIKRTWFDYVLLVVSYVILLSYLYACSQKIEMVKSKWALTFGAVLTVGLSLLMAAGICVHFQLTRRTWLVELFPYLALVVGMENILCMTRSVVSMPTELDARSRVAHGLGIEGWSLTKNFCVGFAVLSCGLLFSNVPEITEFCTVALVGFVTDFYMQLFFYAPCLAFDLARFGPRDKAVLSDNKFHQAASDLPSYSPVVCPFKGLFGRGQSAQTTASSIYNGDYAEQRAAKERTEINVRVASAESTVHLHQIPLPDCLNRMFALRRPRYFQRIFMVIIAGWIVWFAVGVQQWENSVVEPSRVTSRPTLAIQEDYSTDNPNWQLYRCWADYLESRVSTVNGRFVTVLPSVHLTVQLDEALVASTVRGARFAQPVIIENKDHKKLLSSSELQIGRRISWLEVQMTVVLLLTCCLFLIVAVFIFYVCFVGGRNYRWKCTSARICEWKRFSPPVGSGKVKGDRFIVEALPLAFDSLGKEYQTLLSIDDDLLLSLSSDCSVVIWNGRTGQAEHSFWLRRPIVEIKPLGYCSSMVGSAKNFDEDEAYVWSATGRGELVAFGLSNGYFRLHDMNAGGCLIFENRLSNAGITNVLMHSNRVVLARSNGFLDFLELCYSSTALKPHSCQLIRSMHAHRMLINCLQVCNDFLVTVGDDRTAKVCDLNSCTITRSLYGHNAPVISVATDPPDMAFTSCVEGLLCAWNLSEGRLVWMADDVASRSLATVSLALSGAVLIGYCSNRSLWLWSKYTGNLLTRIKPQERQTLGVDFGCIFDLPQLVLLRDNVAAIASRRGIQFWDVISRMMLREVTIEGVSRFHPVRCLTRLGVDSVVCVVDDVIYRVHFPVVKI
uniref:Sterol regulatory element-binding protein cleavage-activating protein n=1 Tax=Trichuris muris TaxID=70415 RepID=A0A5S6QWZ5_TRIMR